MLVCRYEPVQGRSQVTGDTVLTGSGLTTHYSPVLVADNDKSRAWPLRP